MTQSAKVLIAGIGSAHGDDQVGWLVAEELEVQFREDQDVTVRKASIPLDLLDWLEDVEVLHVCDACEATHGQQKLHRFAWIAGQLVNSTASTEFDRKATFQSLRSCGSHDFGLPDVLRLATETRQLPRQVILWAIEGTDFQPGDTLNDETRYAALQAVQVIMDDLRILRCTKNL